MSYGFIPNNELLRLLGCKQHATSTPGYLTTECDDQGRTSIDKIFVVGEAGQIGGAQVALLQGRLTGWSASEALGYPAPPRTSAQYKTTQRQLHRQRIFQQRLWSLFSSWLPLLSGWSKSRLGRPMPPCTSPMGCPTSQCG